MKSVQEKRIISARFAAAALAAIALFTPRGAWSMHRTVTERLAYSFHNKNGENPQGALTVDSQGSLYGTTLNGGKSTGCYRSTSCGIVFKLSHSANGYTEHVLYTFENAGDGAYPNPGLILDENGAFYGTTWCCYDSENQLPVLFKLAPSGHSYAESVVYQFRRDDPVPNGNLVVDGRGAFYGTSTQGGGSLNGSVFKLTPTGSAYKLKILHRFAGGADGAFPVAGLLAGARGEFYGTTELGGGGPCNQGDGCGTVFEIAPAGKGYAESVLHGFQGYDGNMPEAALVIDPAGALYGTTFSGGGSPYSLNGVVFKLTPAVSGYSESVLYDFSSSVSTNPSAPVVIDKSGVIYGTTPFSGPKGHGTIFSLTPSSSGYVEADLYIFQGAPNDGSYVQSGLVPDGSGVFYGTTKYGGNGTRAQGCGNQTGCGAVFEVKP